MEFVTVDKFSHLGLFVDYDIKILLELLRCRLKIRYQGGDTSYFISFRVLCENKVRFFKHVSRAPVQAHFFSALVAFNFDFSVCIITGHDLSVFRYAQIGDTCASCELYIVFKHILEGSFIHTHA